MKDKIEKILVRIFPQFITNFLGVLYGYSRSSRKSFYQYGEDLILKIFFDYRVIRNGFYIDIGAYHPKFISNTYILHKAGWRGVCVDLDEDKLKWFKLLRGNNVSTLCSGVCWEKKAGSDQEVYFYKHKRLLSEIDTLDESTAIQNEKVRGWSFTKKKVSIIDINTLLDKYKNENINF